MEASERSSEKRYHLSRNYLEDPPLFGTTRLVQIGRMYCTGHTVVKTHSHLNWFELTIATGGSGEVITNGTPVVVKSGEIYLSFPGDFHGIVSSPDDPLKYDFFSFSTEDPDCRDELERLINTCMSADRRVFSDDRIRYLVETAIAETGEGEEASGRILADTFDLILLYLIRNFSSAGDRGVSGNVSAPEELCYRMMYYIDTHLYTMQSLAEIADAMNYNYSYLSALFRQHSSTTLLEYYRNRRLEAAKLLLAEGKLSVGAIADLLRYSSVYTFSRAYKEKYGVSPSGICHGER